MEGHGAEILKIIVLEPSKMITSNQEKIPDTPKVITASFDNSILLWDYDKLEIITKMEAPEDSELSCMTFLQNCCLVATGHEKGAIRLWNLEINSSVLLKCHDNQRHRETISCIHGCVWKENNSEFLLCGDYNGYITVWEISERQTGGVAQGSATIFPQLRHVIENNKIEKGVGREREGDEVLVLHFWENEETKEGSILVGGNNRNIQVYSIRNAAHERELVGHTDSVTCMAIDGNLLFTGSDDQTIRQWELTLGTSTGIIGQHDERKCAFYAYLIRLNYLFSSHFLTAIQDLKRLDNGLLLSCAYDGKVICWHYNEDVKFGEFVKENQQLRCMDAVTESGTLLIGTNSLAILTQSITDWVNFSSFGEDGVLQ